MEGFSSVIDRIIEILKIHINDTVFLKAYPNSKKPVPIDRKYIVVGIRKIKVTPSPLGGYQGKYHNNGFYGRNVGVTVGVNIYCPKTMGESGCIDTFSSICDSLVFNGNQFSIGEVKCDQVKFDIYSSSLTAAAEFEVNILAGYSEKVNVVNK